MHPVHLLHQWDDAQRRGSLVRDEISLNEIIFSTRRTFNFIELSRLPVSDMTAGSSSLTLSITENITSQ